MVILVINRVMNQHQVVQQAAQPQPIMSTGKQPMNPVTHQPPNLVLVIHLYVKPYKGLAYHQTHFIIHLDAHLNHRLTEILHQHQDLQLLKICPLN